jgi:hypothetical protein
MPTQCLHYQSPSETFGPSFSLPVANIKEIWLRTHLYGGVNRKLWVVDAADDIFEIGLNSPLNLRRLGVALADALGKPLRLLRDGQRANVQIG